jgi:hypothetical protein
MATPGKIYLQSTGMGVVSSVQDAKYDDHVQRYADAVTSRSHTKYSLIAKHFYTAN